MSELTLGAQAKQRGYFEEDTVFFGDTFNTSKLVDAYERASENAFHSSKMAISSGLLIDLRKAQWDSAVVKTLEQVLSLVKSSSNASGVIEQDEEMTLPDAPSFELA